MLELTRVFTKEEIERLNREEELIKKKIKEDLEFPYYDLVWSLKHLDLTYRSLKARTDALVQRTTKSDPKNQILINDLRKAYWQMNKLIHLIPEPDSEKLIESDQDEDAHILYFIFKEQKERVYKTLIKNGLKRRVRKNIHP